MSVTIELPPEIEEQLRAAAAQQGQDAAAFVRAAVEDKLQEAQRAAALAGEPQTRLDRMLEGLTGVVHSQQGEGGSRLSEQTGADFARDLAEKQRQGRL